MKILSIRKGFQGDHSSTSYEFYAIDKPLNDSEQAAVANLSSRAMPTKHEVSFIYHGDWSDLPGGWQPLVEKYYDVMYSESYDWWTLVMAFNTSPEKIKEIKQYAFNGTDDLGISVYSKGERIIIAIACRVDYCSYANDYHSDYYYVDDDEEEDYEDDGTVSELSDDLLNSLAENREYLKKGDYRLLYGIWQKYGFSEEGNEEFDEEIPPKPPEMDQLPLPIHNLLVTLE